MDLILIIIVVLLLFGGGGYWGYSLPICDIHTADAP
jgi:hypothetical protein